MDRWKKGQSEHLGINQMGKNIRKSPLQPPPQVHNISKKEFRNMVQKLTGLPSQEKLSSSPQKPLNMRLHTNRPPPLLPIKRPPSHPPIPPPLTPPTGLWTNSSESPITAYMRYLETSPIQSLNPTNLPPSNLPSPICQFLLPSPSFLLSPGIGFSPIVSPPSLGPFPLSPSCIFSSPRPKWREQ